MRFLNTERPLLVASDLHGNFEDWQQLLYRFEALQVLEPDLLLVLMGDLIHAYPPRKDDSLMLLDAVRSRIEAGDAILLMGNHELSHVMHWDLKKGNHAFTRRFETEMGPHRSQIVEFLSTLPLALEAHSCVLTHSGAAASVSLHPNPRTQLFLKIKGVRRFLESLSFVTQFEGFEAHREQWNPQAGQAWLEQPAGQVLWDWFMSKNEHTWPEKYEQMVEDFLQGVFPEAQFLITGHIEAEHGFAWPASRQLRLCSSQGCPQVENRKILFLRSRVQGRSDLESGLLPLYGEASLSD